MELTVKQRQIFDEVESSSNNFLILGKPGVGKSVLINALVEQGQKNYTVAAPTGLAAINIGGRTLHSIFRLPIIENGIIPKDMSFPDKRDLGQLYNISSLIIDEVSMVRADTLDYIDRLLRNFRNNDLPFGGIQIILVGDFCQLAPVVNSYARKELKDESYQSGFAFSAKVFTLDLFVIHELTEVLRQKDDLYFMEILSASRFGNISQKMLRDLNDLVGAPKPLAITLTATNREADNINSNEMARLPGKAVGYQHEVSGDWPESLWPLPGLISLKPDAQVMVRKNGADRDPDAEGDQPTVLVNGSLGIIKTLSPSSLELNNSKVFRQRFERKKKLQTDEGWKLQPYATFYQMPVTPAWAISMHKSQGQSFDKVNIDPTKVFGAGQLYVALSRARSMAGLTLLSPVNKNMFMVDKMVKAFYDAL
jgi:ATP-dependent DNA helicase PIF1